MKVEMNNFIKLPVKDLAKKIICDGQVFLSIGEKKFYLMKPGVFVDPAFIKKYAVSNSIFDFNCVVNTEVKEKFRNFFNELHYLQFEKDLRAKCFEITSYFHQVFSSEEHFLSFAVACHEEFCLMNLDDQRKMHETDMHLFRKSLYSAAFSVIVAMTNDFFHYPMLKDFWNLAFGLDFGLCTEGYSYFVAEACNIENRKPGSGKDYLFREGASVLEVELFFRHPERSYEFLKKQKYLAYPELAETALYQHELADGSGFPRKIKKAQVSGWEAVIIFADSLVEIVSDYTFERRVVEYLLQFQNEKLKELPVNRVYKKLCGAFNYMNLHQEEGA